MIVRKKAIVILVLMLAPLALNLTSSSADGESWQVGNFKDMLSFVTEIEVHHVYVDPEGPITNIFRYEIVGDENVEGVDTWKVDFFIGEEETETNYTIWVDKASGLTVKTFSDGMEMTGLMANITGTIVFSMFNLVINSLWDMYSLQNLNEWESVAYGSINSLGTEIQQFGPTSLTVTGVEYEGTGISNLLRYSLEAWYAPTQYGYIMTDLFLDVDSTEGSYAVSFSLESITLSEPQEVPEPEDVSGEETIDDEAPDDEISIDETAHEDTGNETVSEEVVGEEEEEKSGGGIPGFPLESIAAALVLVIALFWTRK